MDGKVKVTLPYQTELDIHRMSDNVARVADKLSELDKDVWEQLRHQNTLLEYLTLGVWALTLMMLIGIPVIAICLCQ